jgi:hypothetical protein
MHSLPALRLFALTGRISHVVQMGMSAAHEFSKSRLGLPLLLEPRSDGLLHSQKGNKKLKLACDPRLNLSKSKSRAIVILKDGWVGHSGSPVVR